MSSEQEPTPIAMTLVRMKHRVEGPYLLVGLDSWEEQLWITWTTPEEAQRQAESARHYAEAWTDEETEDWVLVPSAVRAAEQAELVAFRELAREVAGIEAQMHALPHWDMDERCFQTEVDGIKSALDMLWHAWHRLAALAPPAPPEGGPK